MEVIELTEAKEFFGDIISTYSQEQAIDDGVLMQNLSDEFPECNLLTANLWKYIEDSCHSLILTEPRELLDCIMKQAKRIYVRRKFIGDNNRDFFVIKGKGRFKAVWFVRNEGQKLTAMLASDY